MDIFYISILGIIFNIILFFTYIYISLKKQKYFIKNSSKKERDRINKIIKNMIKIKKEKNINRSKYLLYGIVFPYSYILYMYLFKTYYMFFRSYKYALEKTIEADLKVFNIKYER